MKNQTRWLLMHHLAEGEKGKLIKRKFEGEGERLL